MTLVPAFSPCATGASRLPLLDWCQRQEGPSLGVSSHNWPGLRARPLLGDLHGAPTPRCLSVAWGSP